MFKKHPYRAVILIFLFGSLISVSVFLRIQSWEETKIQDEVRFRAESRITILKQSYGQIFDAAGHTISLIQNEIIVEEGDFLAQEEFDTFIDLLPQKKESLVSIAWVPQISHASYKELQQGASFPQHSTLKQYIKSVQNHSHFPVFLKELKSDSVLSKIDDLFESKEYQDHINRSRDRAQAQIHYYEGGQKEIHILLFSPVYNTLDTPVSVEERRKALLGFVVSEWNVSALLENTIRSLPTNSMDVTIESFSKKDSISSPFMLLLHHPSRSRLPKDEGVYTGVKWSQEFPMGEHQWRITYEAAPAFMQLHPKVLSFESLFLGMLISFGISLYVWFAIRNTQSIKLEVQKRTQELSEKRAHLQKTLEDLQISETRFRKLVGQSPFGIQIFDPTGKTITINPAWEKLWEKQVQRLDSYNIFEDTQLIQKNIMPLVQQAFSGEISEIPPIEYRVKVRESNEEGAPPRLVKKWVRSFIYPIKSRDGEVHEVVSIQEDYTLQHESFAKLRQMAVVLEALSESVVVTNRDGFILYVNPVFELISGYTSEEVLGKKPSILKSGEHPEEYYQVMWKKIAQGETWKGSFINSRKDGTTYIVEQSIVAFYNELAEIDGFIAVQRDVTEERAQQERKEHSQRLESLGVLAGGIAHDFNNLLAVIMGYTSMAISVLGKSHPMTEHLKKVVISSKTAGELCNQMLAYSGQGNYVIEEFSINEMVQEMVELLTVSISKQVDLYIEPINSSCYIKGDISQIKQILMNIVINGSEAIDECQCKGTVAVSVIPLEMEDADFEGCIYEVIPPSGMYVCLRIQDNGCGMTEEVLLKLFDPFFSTKFTGRGLGASAILGIVRSHNGAIRVESILGEGSCFEVYFPCTKVLKGDDTSEIPAEELVSETETAEARTVLVIDDELSIRALCTQMIESFGYSVISAEDGVSGIEIFKKHQDEVHFVLMDLSMPGIDGIQCAKQILNIDPSVSIVLSSGYTEQEIEGRLGGVELKGFLKKPYSMAHVQNMLENMLEIIS